MSASDLNKAEGESVSGSNIYTVDLLGEHHEQLATSIQPHINTLVFSKDGEELYYSVFTGNRDTVYAFSIHDQNEKLADFKHLFPRDTYLASFDVSTDKNSVLYTGISEASLTSNLFKYELYMKDIASEQTTKLTELDSLVHAPIFFHQSNTVAFLQDLNWPIKPEMYRFMTLDLETKALQQLEFELPESVVKYWFFKTVDRVINGWTVASLYVLFITALTLHFHKKQRRTYIPTMTSFGVSIFLFLSSFVVAGMTNPWYGIGIAMLAGAMFFCTFIVLLFAFILRKRMKN